LILKLVHALILTVVYVFEFGQVFAIFKVTSLIFAFQAHPIFFKGALLSLTPLSHDS